MTFAEELRAAMTARGYTINALAEAVPCHFETVAKARQGKHVPTLAIAHAMANVLCWQSLGYIADRASTKRCAVCRRRYVTDGHARSHSRYCSAMCKRRRDNATRLTRERSSAAGQLRAAHAAIEKFCRTCEPVGPCRDAQCPLRPVSPLPLIQLTRRVA